MPGVLDSWHYQSLTPWNPDSPLAPSLPLTFDNPAKPVGEVVIVGKSSRESTGTTEHVVEGRQVLGPSRAQNVVQTQKNCVKGKDAPE